MYVAYFLTLASFAFPARRGTNCICFPKFHEILDSMDSKANVAIFRIFSRGILGCTVNFWSGRRGSNPQPTAWEAATLPLSYSRFEWNYTVTPDHSASQIRHNA